MRAINLNLTPDELTSVAKHADGRGRAKIDRALISKLVVDHSIALNALREAGVQVGQAGG